MTSTALPKRWSPSAIPCRRPLPRGRPRPYRPGPSGCPRFVLPVRWRVRSQERHRRTQPCPPTAAANRPATGPGRHRGDSPGAKWWLLSPASTSTRGMHNAWVLRAHDRPFALVRPLPAGNRRPVMPEPNEPPGRWWGHGCAAMELSGEVQPDRLAALLEGRHPGHGGRLRRSFGAKSARGSTPPSRPRNPCPCCGDSVPIRGCAPRCRPPTTPPWSPPWTGSSTTGESPGVASTAWTRSTPKVWWRRCSASTPAEAPIPSCTPTPSWPPRSRTPQECGCCSTLGS